MTKKGTPCQRYIEKLRNAITVGQQMDFIKPIHSNALKMVEKNLILQSHNNGKKQNGTAVMVRLDYVYVSNHHSKRSNGSVILSHLSKPSVKWRKKSCSKRLPNKSVLY